MTRILARIHRFIHNRRTVTATDRLKGPLSAVELNNSLLTAIKISQSEEYQGTLYALKNGRLPPLSLTSLSPLLDKDGCLTVGGRLDNSNLSPRAKHPWLISKNSPLATLICDHYHRLLLHSGLQTTLSMIRRRFWIPSLRSLLRQRIRMCSTCYRLTCVHSAKKLLVRQVGDTILTIEEFSTLLHRIEAVLNSRPLIAPSNDPIDGVDYLTPGHFLIGTALTSLPEPPSDNSMSSPTRWRLVQQMSYNFWEQWSKDYLNTLMQRNKWKRPQPNLTVGQLVYVRNLNTSPLTWPVGLITALHPGTDGVIRVVDVKIGGKNFTRAVTTLVPLP
ncbi:hypothetical protein PPYR_00221 [Photinus pyralis]|uniref:DUF5641 domain-containing protein n=1 Tax=Photinus pyralis TaxID=7054 RepID=A0A5N4B0X0_PHOPY|nr:hypothetical protein PPYR_00221 [Photinus pyralis]